MYRSFFKRFFDFILAFAACLVLSPIIVLLGIVLVGHHRGSPIIIQKRPGKNERIFKLIKFKTMNNAKDNFGNLLPDAQRLKSFGKFIRSTSFDEIPQLLNVIQGDMSLIGPRPLLPEYLPLYNNFQKQRHLVKPGITGWAQVNGRNAITWQKKFEFDVWYVKNVNFVLDIKILFLTLKKVVLLEGITAKDHVSMPSFQEYIEEKKKSNL